MDDRSTRAKLRDAAIEIIATDGVGRLTARGVAERAGLSPGLIRHHFGSMARLQQACDHHVAATIKRLKHDAIQGGSALDALAVLRQPDNARLMGYLASRLGDDSPEIDALVDAIVEDAAGYLAEGEAAGLIAPTGDPHSRASMLTIFSLGSLVLHRHLQRLLGVDVRAADLVEQPGFTEYLRAQIEVLAAVLTPTTIALYQETLTALQEES